MQRGATNWNGFSHGNLGNIGRANHIVTRSVKWHLLCLEEDLLPITALEEDFVLLLDEYCSAPPVAEQHELSDVGVAGEGGHVQGAPTVPACPARVRSVPHHQLHQRQLAGETGLLEGSLALRVESVYVDPL